MKFISTPCLYFTKKATEYLSPDVFNTKKSITLCDAFSALLAEREGFEPPEPRSSTVFKTAAIDHSAISPGAKVEHFFGLTKYFYIFFKIFFSRYFLSNHKILIISKKYDVFFGLLKKCLIFVLHIITN